MGGSAFVSRKKELLSKVSNMYEKYLRSPGSPVHPRPPAVPPQPNLQIGEEPVPASLLGGEGKLQEGEAPCHDTVRLYSD